MKALVILAAALLASTAIASAAPTPTPAPKPSATPFISSGPPQLSIDLGKDGRCTLHASGPLGVGEVAQLFAVELQRTKPTPGLDGDLALREQLRQAEAGVERCLTEAGILR